MERTHVIGWGFMIFGIFVLFTPISWTGISNSVAIINFVFPFMFGTLFLIGGFFISKKKILGVYFVWAGCILGPLNVAIDEILVVQGESVMDFVVGFNLILAILANFAFSDVLKPKPPIQQNMVHFSEED